MSNHVDDLKRRLSRDPEIVIVEEETMSQERQTGGSGSSSSIVDELGRLGRKLAESAKAAKESDQAEKLQTDLLQGWEKFQQEAGRVISEVRDEAGDAAEKIRTRSGNEGSAPVIDAHGDADSEGGSRFNVDIDKEAAKENMVKGLRWLSGEMTRMADRFQEAGGQTVDDVSDQIKIDPS